MTFEEKKKIVIDNYFKSECNINMTIKEAYTKGFERGLSKAPKEERKTGKWIQISPAGIYECSLCHQNVMTDDIGCYKFCHNCGEKMEGAGSEDIPMEYFESGGR